MYQTIEFSLKGITGLMVHNGQLANPLNPFSKAMKSVSSKRKKTDEDFVLLSRLEWLGGLYTSETIEFELTNNSVVASGGGKIILPGEGFEAMLLSAGKKLRLGETIKSAVLVDDCPVLEFPDMNKPIAKLIDEPKYTDIRKVRVQKNAIMRTRPFFPEWTTTVKVSYLPDLINIDTLIQIVEIGGRVTGLFEYRPKFGRYEVAKVAA